MRAPRASHGVDHAVQIFTRRRVAGVGLRGLSRTGLYSRFRRVSCGSSGKMTTAVEPARAEQTLWRPMIAAMGKTGAGSIASGLLSALGTKIIATLLGPGPVALLQTLQQLRDGAVIAATANGKTALVQGASALEGVARREYVRAVALAFAGGTFFVALATFAVPGEIVRWSRLPAG